MAHASQGTSLAAATDGVLTRRLFAYGVDLVMIFGFTILLGILVAFAGVFTFGLAWGLYAILIPVAAVLYSALTVGGASQATVGMRMFGLRAVDAETGGPVGMLLAAAHAFLFYVGIGTVLLLAIDIAIGIARSDRRLGHDLLVGMVVVRT